MSTLVIFDCDGVLVDSEALSISLEVDLLQAAGFSVTEDEICERFVGMTYSGMIRELEKQHSLRAPTDLQEAIESRVLEAFPKRLQGIPGMQRVLRGFEERGTPRCVASSSNLDRIELSLEVTGLHSFFEQSALFSAEMVEHGKPAPDLFLHAAETLGFAPGKCVVIEDSPHGVHAGRAAGMRVLGFVGGGHARPSLAQRLLAAGADLVLERAEGLAAHIEPCG